MARKKATKEASVVLVTPREKFVPKKFYERNAWSIQIKSPDGKLRGKLKTTENGWLEVYFFNLDKIIASNHPTKEKAPEILEKYINIYKNYKIASKYEDTWGNIWKGKCSFPDKDRMLNYIINKIKEYERSIDNV